MGQTKWDEMDEQACREASSLGRAFRSAGIAPKAMRGGVWRTTRGGGDGAAARPASGGFTSKVAHLTDDE